MWANINKIVGACLKKNLNLDNLTDSPSFFHDHSSLVIGILSDENISDSKGEAFGVQEIGEQLRES